MDGDKKIKVVQLFEENSEPSEDPNHETTHCRAMPTIQINYGNAKITSGDIHINITVSIN